MTDTEITNRMSEIRDLLREYGLTLYGFDPGVTAFDEDGTPLRFDAREWAWLEPLLIELRRKRGVK